MGFLRTRVEGPFFRSCSDTALVEVHTRSDTAVVGVHTVTALVAAVQVVYSTGLFLMN